jgi:hypothetical protein
MRCLYCGKELALLKRWTGGGEFCSEGHRQQYQEEYNQLALNRLLQAKPPILTAEETAPPPAPASVAPQAAPSRGAAARADKQLPAAPLDAIAAAKAPARMEDPRRGAPPPIAEPAPGAARVASPVASPHASPAASPLDSRRPEPPRHAEPEPEPEEELAPAAIAGFFIELPVPVLAEVMAMARTDAGFESNGKPALPRRQFDAWETQLVAAGRVESAPFTRILDCTARPRDRKLDARDFVRTAPLVEVDLDPAGETELPEMIEEPMDILIFPHPPHAAPPLWEEPWQEFTLDKNLGALARVAFRTTGLEDNQDASDPLESLAEVAPDSARPVHIAPDSGQSAAAAHALGGTEEHSEPVAAKAAPAIPEPEIAKPFARPAPAPEPNRVTAAPPVAPTPPVTVTPPTPVISRPAFLRPAFMQAAGKPVQTPEKTAPAAVNKKSAEAPPVVTKPLPLTLHGLAAGRGKPVQVFASVAAGVDLQIPRSNALPLRPVMTLGPALSVAVEEKRPADRTPERTVVVKVDPKKGPPARPESRSTNGKGRKYPPTPEPVESDAEKKESGQKAAAAAKAPPVRPAERPAANAVAERPPERVRESTLPAPLAAPYHPPDLGLPSLDLEASGGFWKRLPLSGKAGLALTMVALTMAIIFIMKSGTSAAAGPRVVEAPAFTAAEGGWITDWGVEPGVRTVRDISVLRPTLNMSDYRIEFQAQIESKALGWVYRAQDVKNYYVSKLEIVKPGINPTVSVVRYAVIGGEEGPHAQLPLNMPVRIDTMYKVRFDAVGDHFTTWVQDQKVDDWTDARLKTGGVGLYSDRGESRILKSGSLRVAPLVVKK